MHYVFLLETCSQRVKSLYSASTQKYYFYCAINNHAVKGKKSSNMIRDGKKTRSNLIRIYIKKKSFAKQSSNRTKHASYLNHYDRLIQGKETQVITKLSA
jgi:hypothetical protein